MAEIAQGLKLFADFKVDCVVVGGVAAGARGSSHVTYDLDVCYSRNPANLARLVQALRSVNATLRGAPRDLPFRLDAETLARGLNFTFNSDIGSILGEVQGVGDYQECLQDSNVLELFDNSCRVSGKIDCRKNGRQETKDLAGDPSWKRFLNIAVEAEQQNGRIYEQDISSLYPYRNFGARTYDERCTTLSCTALTHSSSSFSIRRARVEMHSKGIPKQTRSHD